MIGPPGSGKTVCGQALARLLGCRFFDTDQLIEMQQAMSVTELFASKGETHFRQLETMLLESLEQTYQQGGPIIFATGGGLPIYNENLSRIERLGKVVSLSASLAVLLSRVQDDRCRPLLAATAQPDANPQLQNRLSELIERRAPLYNKARYKIDTSGLRPEEVAHEIIRMIYGRE